MWTSELSVLNNIFCVHCSDGTLHTGWLTKNLYKNRRVSFDELHTRFANENGVFMSERQRRVKHDSSQ